MRHARQSDSHAIRLETFSGLRIVRPDGRTREVDIPVGEKPGVLLVVLALAGEAGVPRATIRTLLWPESSDGNASNSLRQALFRLRRALGAKAIEDRGGRLFLRLPVSLDVVDVAAHLERGDLTSALDLMTTPVGHTLDVAGPALRDWFLRYREQIDQRLESLIRAAWSEEVSGAVLALLTSAVPTVRQLLPTSVDLLWIQLEIDARNGEVAAFERHAQELRTLAPASPQQTQRLSALRLRLTSGASAQHLRPPSLHEEALQRLQGQVATVNREEAIVWVTGPNGIGRTRLLQELRRRLDTQGLRAILVGTESRRDGLLSSCCRDLAVALSALRGAAGLDPRFAPTIERLTRQALHPVGPEAIEAVLDLSAAIAGEGPLALLIDDAHRYDARELHALVSAIEQQRAPGLTTILSVPAAAVPTRLIGAVLTLPPLSAPIVRQMVEEMAALPAAPWTALLIDGVTRASGGIPRRILHVLTSMHREGLLRDDNGRWTLLGGADELRTRLQRWEDEALGR